MKGKDMRHPIFAVMATACAVVMTASAALADVECTIENWTDQVELDNDAVGTPSNNNRRFAGPCGLRVPVDGTARYLVDSSPDDESSYNARFYFFVNGTLPDGAVIFSARTEADDADVLTLRNTSSGMVLDGVGSTAIVSTGPSALRSGWNVVEISWDQSSASMTLNDAGEQTITSGLDDSLTIGAVRLGNVSGATGTDVSIDFDDFDSRRASMPERLLAGDANGDGVINAGDIVAARSEALGLSTAEGQPDCNKDGAVNAGDIVCTRAKALGLQ